MCTVIVSISNLTNIYKCTFRYKNYILKNTGTSTNFFRENIRQQFYEYCPSVQLLASQVAVISNFKT